METKIYQENFNADIVSAESFNLFDQFNAAIGPNTNMNSIIGACSLILSSVVGSVTEGNIDDTDSFFEEFGKLVGRSCQYIYEDMRDGGAFKDFNKEDK